ncbi:MAG: NUDIX hydrolase [Candidatus Paceibacterota bacterium]
MGTKEKALYFVAVKILLRDGDKLFLIKDVFDDGWDLPGGRIKHDEFDTPLLDIISRKMNEEVGTEVRYEIDPTPKVYFRHRRIEAETGEPVQIFALGYEATYRGGEPVMGDHMDRYEWVDVHTFTPETYLRGGWLKGVQEYLEHTNVR